MSGQVEPLCLSRKSGQVVAEEGFSDWTPSQIYFSTPAGSHPLVAIHISSNTSKQNRTTNSQPPVASRQKLSHHLQPRNLPNKILPRTASRQLLVASRQPNFPHHSLNSSASYHQNLTCHRNLPADNSDHWGHLRRIV